MNDAVTEQEKEPAQAKMPAPEESAAGAPEAGTDAAPARAGGLTPGSRLRAWPGTWGLPLLLYTLLAAALVAPAYMDSQSRIIGGGELGGWLWRYWWMKLEIVALGLELPHDPLARFLHMVSLGRFPETGNITDLYALSVPLDLLFGHPGHYNAKVLVILLTNALSAYAYALYLTGRRGVSLIAGLTFACNTFVFYEIQRSGLRQALLCFIPLYALSLDRLLNERKLRHGVAAGLTFAATAVFYWFFGLFMAGYTALRVGWFVIAHRARLHRALIGPALVAGVVAVAGILPFMMPYLSKDFQDPNAPRLPEVSWFTSFPTLEALQNAPLRPETLEQNLLSSQARVLYSSWSPDWAFNPLQSWVVPVAMGLFAIVLSIFRFRKTAFWLGLWLLFYTLTWGPYFQYGGEFIKIGGEHTIRLPYWYAFKFVPMMSRLFAPYRMGSIVVFAMAVLLALNLAAIAARLERWRKTRLLLGMLFVAAYLGQFMWDPMRYLGIGSNKMLPLEASEVTIPPWYYKLAREKGRIGIIELPLDRQQDLLNYYQMAHAKKVMGGWATPGALPPLLRFHTDPSKVTALLHWLSRPDGLEANGFVLALRNLGRMPYQITDFSERQLSQVKEFGYRYVVLHELGCYMMEPRWGKELYQRMKHQLEEKLGPPVEEFVELEPTDNAEDMIPIRNGMEWVPSIYSPLLIPEPRPVPLRMAVYALQTGTDTEEARGGLE